MDILKNILDRQLNQEDILIDMFSEYEEAERNGLLFKPMIAKSLSDQLGIPYHDMLSIVEKYVYKNLARRYMMKV